MSAARQPAESVPPVASKPDKERELERLFRAGIVREKTQLHSLLTYLGARALEDSGEALKEYTIGVEALGKPTGYDPRIDPTVRVEVAKLRAKLKDYYRDAGAQHPLRLEIPKGTYVPEFTVVGPPASRTGPRLGKWSLGLGCALVALLLVLVWDFRRPHPDRPASDLEAFWAPHLSGGIPTLLVYGAPLFLKMQGGYYRNPDVNNPDEFAGNRKTQTILEALEPREVRPVYTFTGVGEAEALFRVTRLLAVSGAGLNAQGSNTVTWEDLKDKHVVFLGGRKFNPQLPNLPYKPKFEAINRRIVNLEPGAGEPPEYRTASVTSHGEITEEYALISVCPGITAHTRLMALECSSTEGTLAAAEFVTRADTMAQLMAHRLPLREERGKYRAFQVVIGAKFNKGVVVSLFYKTHRVLD